MPLSQQEQDHQFMETVRDILALQRDLAFIDAEFLLMKLPANLEDLLMRGGTFSERLDHWLKLDTSRITTLLHRGVEAERRLQQVREQYAAFGIRLPETS